MVNTARARYLWWVVVAVLLAVLASGISSLSNLSTATSWIRHTDQVRVALGRLRSTLLGAENGLRSYTVAGERVFLEPYQRGDAEWRDQLETIRALTVDNPQQQERIDRLRKGIEERLGLMAATRAQFDAGKRGAELTPIMLDGKRSMDALRAVLDEMEGEEVRLDELRQNEADQRRRLTLLLFVAGALAFLVVVAAVWQQRRAVEERHRRSQEIERAIESERRLLQAVLTGIEDGITLQDRSGKLIFANLSGARLIGFPSPEALLAASLGEVMRRFEVYGEDGGPFPPEKLPARAVFEGQANPEPVLLRYRVRDGGEDRWSHVRAYPVLDADGKVSHAVNIFRDVTVEHRAEERREFLLRAVGELSSSLDYELTLRSVARLAVPTLADWCAVDLVDGDRTRSVAVAHLDPGKIKFVEELSKRYPPDPNATTGLPQIIRSGQAELMSEIPAELIRAAAVDEEHLQLIDQIELRSYIGVPLKVRGTTIGAMTFAMAESRRHYAPADLEFAQALADRAALAIENARLFTEVEQARASTTVQLAVETERRVEAEGASRFAEMFVGILGHDLRNPLNAVQMGARLLKKKGGADPKTLERITSSVQRMSNMVGQLLDLTRSRLGGGIVLEKRLTDVAGVIGPVIEELRLAHPGREIRWEPRPGLSALVDQDRLGQVVSNLVGNAIEHGDPTRPVSVQLMPRGATLTLMVHSHGPPIPSELLPVIFDPFRRTTARTRRSKGLGLGLFITEQIVLAHGGRVDVQSSADEGTTFAAVLPRAMMGSMDSSEESAPSGQ